MDTAGSSAAAGSNDPRESKVPVSRDEARNMLADAFGGFHMNTFYAWYTTTSILMIFVARFANLWPDPIDLTSLFIFPVFVGMVAAAIKSRADRRRTPTRRQPT